MSNTVKAAIVVVGAALVGMTGYRLMSGGGADEAQPLVDAQSTDEAQPRVDALAATSAAIEVVVYKSATCGCCSNWAEYLRDNGLTVRIEDVTDLTAVKAKLGVPSGLQSCHTAVIEGYVIEGHVPIEPIRRLLEERPEIVGLAVPGMPTGSPGMETPGRLADSYDIVAFDEAGNTSVYESR
jgi:hypothetical protein